MGSTGGNAKEVVKGRISAVLFDKDGTLFHYHETWGPILHQAADLAAQRDKALVPALLEAVGYDAASRRIRAGSIFAGGETMELARAWREMGVPHEQSDLVALLDDLFTREAPIRSRPVTDLAALFSRLAASGLVLGIATNDSAASALVTIERFGLGELLAFHCGYDSGHGAKPGPGMVHAFCRSAGLSPPGVAVVGDNRHDLEMGRAAGAGLLVGVLTGTSAREHLAPYADAVIDSIADLPALLETSS